ncbi:Ig-like domain-containing protein [Myxococcota bacterium]
MRRLLWIVVVMTLCGTADAATTVTASASDVGNFLGGRTGKLVYVDNNDSGKCYWIDLSDMSVHKLSDDTNVSEPLLSPDGSRVVYGLYNIISKWPGESSDNEGDAYIRSLGGGSRSQVAGGSVAGKQAFAPHWWVDPANGNEYIVYMDYYEKDTQGSSGRGTWKQRIISNQPSGNPVKILNHAFDGGLSKDGQRIGEAYHYLHMARTSDLGGGNGDDISSRLDGGNQCCNASMSPDNQYHIMHLRIDHGGCNIRDANDNEIQVILKPSSATEMQNPEFSTDPGYSTFTAQFGSSYYMYIANTQTGANLKIAEGNFGVPHLWVASSSPTLSLTPTSLDFNASEGGGNPADKSVTITNAGEGTLDLAIAGESAGWLTVTRSGNGNNQTLVNAVDISGLSAGIHSQTVQVTCANASNSPQSYEVNLEVVGLPVLTSIEITPSSVSIQPSQTATFTARAYDQHGNPFAAVIDWAATAGGSMAPASSGSAVTEHSSIFTSDGSEGNFGVEASSAGTSDTAMVNVSTQPPLHLRINCGDNGFDVTGWSRDDDFVSGGEDWTNSNSVDTTGVANAAPADVYRSVRHKVSATGSYPAFNVPEVDDGSYTVRLHFADASAGPRHINVDIEGQRVLSDYDISSDAGGTNKAVVKSFPVTVSDGNGMSIDMGSQDDSDSFIAGIEVEVSTDAENPTVTVTSPTENDTVMGTITVEGTANDDVSVDRVEVKVDDRSYALASGTDTWSYTLNTVALLDGAHSITAQATDTSGNTGTAAVNVDVNNEITGPSITLLSPNGGEVWQTGSVQHITWEALGIDDVTLRYSIDNGENWQIIEITIDMGNPQWLDYSWEVPETPSTECLVYISGYFGEVPTQSAEPFEITTESTGGDGQITIKGACGCGTGTSTTPLLLLLALLAISRRRR